MSARKTGTTLATLVLLGGMAAALLLPQTLVAQGGLILAEGLAPTELYRLDLVSPGVNEGQFLLDMVHAEIVHAITICPGDDRVLGIGADIPAISIVDLGEPVPTDVLVGFLPDEFIFSVFQLACSLDGEFFFTNLLDEGFYTIDPDTDCVGTFPNILCTPQLVGILRTAGGTTVDTHGADIEFTDDGNLYLVTNNIDPAADIRDFYQVDPNTAIATLIKEDVTPENNTGMGETIDGRLITSSVDDNLYQINPVNGDATSLGTVTVIDPGGNFTLNIQGGDMAGRAPGGTIIVEKQTDPDGSNQSFEFEPSWDANFSLTDGQQEIFVDLMPTDDGGGLYSVTEMVPSGWDLTSAVCSDGSPATAIDLADGETVTCVFTNTLQRGAIAVQKLTIPTGSTQAFEFVPSWKSNFFLTHGAVDTTTQLMPTSAGGGPYSVSENVPAGWGLTSASCDDGSSPGNIDLAPGETVTCTFVNTLEIPPGRIIIQKITDPVSPDGFGFTDNIAIPGAFILSHGQQEIFDDVEPGTYMVTEGDPTQQGFLLTDITCIDSDQGGTGSSGDIGTHTATINLDPGETVTCTFTNTEIVDECPPSIDFETDASGLVRLVPGEIIDDTNQPWASEGIWLSTGDPVNHPLMIFDTSAPTGGDVDLGTPNERFTIPPDFIIPGPGRGNGGKSNQLPRGQVLIISEDADPSDPDDVDAPGLMRFDFDPPVELTEIRLLDIERGESGGTATAYDDVGNVILTRPLFVLGDNSFEVVQFLRKDVSRLDIELEGSAALTAVIFCEDICILPPEPPE
ncbi:MAG: hypothetical protein WBG96_00005, partial [Thermoanaerobaculia bacterium]